MSSDEDQQAVLLRLTRAEALVLFEWLARVDAAGAIPVEDPAEEQVLWTLEAQLESTLVEPLKPDYAEILEAARKEVHASSGGRSRRT